MKTLRIVLFIIFGVIFTLHSFAQEVKREKKAKIKMEVIDDEGNKKVIDTSFTIAPDQDYAETIRQIKEDAGFSSDEIAKMQQKIKMHAKHLAFKSEDMMRRFDKDSMHKHMLVVHKEMQEGKDKLRQSLEELKTELESLKMNEGAMEKLEKAMEELHKVEWKEHAKLMEVRMDKLHKNLNKNFKVFFRDKDDGQKHIFYDKHGDKEFNLEVIVEGDSLDFIHKKNVFIHGDGKQNSWVEKDGDKIIIRKMKKHGNEIFFGDESDLKNIHEMDGKHKIIIKKLRDEAAKGEAIFISDDAHVVGDDHVKVVRYSVNQSDTDSGEMEIVVDIDEDYDNSGKGKVLMISSANEKEIAKATAKGILKTGVKFFELSTISLEVENETVSIGTTFEKKGKLNLSVLDKDMNQIWEKNAGKVSGDWSTEIPADVLKESGKYFILFNLNKKLKMYRLITK